MNFLNISFLFIAWSPIANAQSLDPVATSQAFNSLTNQMNYVEERMDYLEQGWNKLLNSAVVGFRTNQCPPGWMPVSNATALVVTGSKGNVGLLRLAHIEGQIALRAESMDGVPVQQILFCVRSSAR